MKNRIIKKAQTHGYRFWAYVHKHQEHYLHAFCALLTLFLTPLQHLIMQLQLFEHLVHYAHGTSAVLTLTALYFHFKGVD